MSQIGIIIEREFNERVRKKSFIITTLLMPLLVVALMVAPSLVMVFATGDTRHVAVVDHSGLIAPSLENSSEVVFEPADLSADEAARPSPTYSACWRSVPT